MAINLDLPQEEQDVHTQYTYKKLFQNPAVEKVLRDIDIKNITQFQDQKRLHWPVVEGSTVDVQSSEEELWEEAVLQRELAEEARSVEAAAAEAAAKEAAAKEAAAKEAAKKAAAVEAAKKAAAVEAAKEAAAVEAAKEAAAVEAAAVEAAGCWSVKVKQEQMDILDMTEGASPTGIHIPYYYYYYYY
jgi:uncharacterized membrane protein YqiK